MDFFHWSFYIPVLVYFILILWISGKSWSTLQNPEKLGKDEEFFLAGRGVSVILSFMSVMATETSVATIVIFPAVGFTHGYNLIWLVFGYIGGRITVALWYLPAVYRGKCLSVYSDLMQGSVTGPAVLNYAYLAAKYISSGVRFFMGGFALSSVFGGETAVWILVIAGVTGFYSIAGGLRSVIWTDLFQGLIIIGTAVFFLIPAVMNGHIDISSVSFINTDLKYSNEMYFLSLFLGGLVLSVGTHGADQDLLLRVLAVKNLKKAQISMVISGFAAGTVILLYLSLGIFLSAAQPGLDPKSPFLSFIKLKNNPFLNGLFAILLTAAAMSTLDSAMHSTAAVLKDRFRTGSGRLWSFVSLALLTLSAVSFISIEKNHKDFLSLAMSSMNYINGGLIGVFTSVLILKLRPSGAAAMGALITGFATTAAVTWIPQPPLAWTWTIVVSSGASVAAYYLLSRPSVSLKPRSRFIF